MKTLSQVAMELPEMDARQLAVERLGEMQRDMKRLISVTAQTKRSTVDVNASQFSRELAERTLKAYEGIYGMAKGNLQRYNVFDPNYDKIFEIALTTGEVKYFDNEEVTAQ